MRTVRDRLMQWRSRADDEDSKYQDRTQQIACVKREIAMRERVYPKWVESGRMKLDMAEREIATMTAVLRSLEEIEGGKDGVRQARRLL